MTFIQGALLVAAHVLFVAVILIGLGLLLGRVSLADPLPAGHRLNRALGVCLFFTGVALLAVLLIPPVTLDPTDPAPPVDVLYSVPIGRYYLRLLPRHVAVLASLLAGSLTVVYWLRAARWVRRHRQ